MTPKLTMQDHRNRLRDSHPSTIVIIEEQEEEEEGERRLEWHRDSRWRPDAHDRGCSGCRGPQDGDGVERGGPDERAMGHGAVHIFCEYTQVVIVLVHAFVIIVVTCRPLVLFASAMS